MMKLVRGRNHQPGAPGAAAEEPHLRFEAPALVDTFHPGEDELVALKDVSEHPQDIAASVQKALEESGRATKLNDEILTEIRERGVDVSS